MEWEIPDSMSRCPTCGKFVGDDDGYGDIEPGDHYEWCQMSAGANFTRYCNATCADSKPDPCTAIR